LQYLVIFDNVFLVSIIYDVFLKLMLRRLKVTDTKTLSIEEEMKYLRKDLEVVCMN